MTDATQRPSKDQLPEHWSVTVEANAETLLTISSQHVAGRELSDSDEKVVEGAARHLLAFIGAPEMPLDDQDEYARARSLSDEAIVKECMESWQQVVRELANRYDVVVEKLDELHDAHDNLERERDKLNADLAESQQLLNSEWFNRVTYKQQARAAQENAERWQAYLKFYDREEMVAAEWDGPVAITTFIDAMRAAQPPGDG